MGRQTVAPTRHQATVDAQVGSVASLAEPVRRQLYRYVSGQTEPVSREQAAVGVGVAQHVAKFHLDKLHDDGLLEVDYRRPPGRTGPGAGRPAKVYRRVARDIAVSLPERRYDLVGRLMAEAITASATTAEPVATTLLTAARTAGRRMGAQARHSAGSRPTSDTLISAACGVLDDNGYEPDVTSGCITLHNCPFHSLAKDFTNLVCGMNLELITGLVDALEHDTLHPHLDPAKNRCCVRIARARTGAP